MKHTCTHRIKSDVWYTILALPKKNTVNIQVNIQSLPVHFEFFFLLYMSFIALLINGYPTDYTICGTIECTCKCNPLHLHQYMYIIQLSLLCEANIIDDLFRQVIFLINSG